MSRLPKFFLTKVLKNKNNNLSLPWNDDSFINAANVYFFVANIYDASLLNVGSETHQDAFKVKVSILETKLP
jgi:hypothetical protein